LSNETCLHKPLDTEEELERKQQQSPSQTQQPPLREPWRSALSHCANPPLRPAPRTTNPTTWVNGFSAPHRHGAGETRSTCALQNSWGRQEGPSSDLRWHSCALSAVAGFQGNWLKPGQQRSQDPPQVLCWQSHCSLRGRGTSYGHGRDARDGHPQRDPAVHSWSDTETSDICSSKYYRKEAKTLL